MRNWTPIREYQEILFDRFEGIARITINRPRYRNAFTPTTVMEISNALGICREDPEIRVVVLTGAHSPAKEGQSEAERLRTEAFCSGGDMHVKGRAEVTWEAMESPDSTCSKCRNKFVPFRNR